MQLDDVAKSLLTKIFKDNLNNPHGVKVQRFRADNHRNIPTLNDLESDRLLERRNENYYLKLKALPEIDTLKDVKILLANCEILFRILRQYYFDQTEEKICLNCLTQLSALKKERVQVCLTFMVEASIFRSWMLNITEEDFVVPSESILKYDNFSAILQEMHSLKTASPESFFEATGAVQTLMANINEGTDIHFFLHSTIIEHAWPQLKDGHFRDAVLNSIIAVFDLIREKTGLKDDGDKLIGKAFSLDDPYLIFSELDTESGQNDQKGFMQILRGAFQGIRNPKAHTLTHDLTFDKAAQYLIFASLLARRVDEALAVKKDGL